MSQPTKHPTNMDWGILINEAALGHIRLLIADNRHELTEWQTVPAKINGSNHLEMVGHATWTLIRSSGQMSKVWLQVGDGVWIGEIQFASSVAVKGHVVTLDHFNLAWSFNI